MSQRPMLDVVVPAAGIGSRMQADKPKQYITIANTTILEHTLQALKHNSAINRIIVALQPNDPYFSQLAIATDPQLIIVDGGKERADSVLAGLEKVSSEYVLVHDAARPCLAQDDLTKLIDSGTQHPVGAILGCPVKDTMKRCNPQGEIIETVSRERLWHALTPQLFKTQALKTAIKLALSQRYPVTDEASAMEFAGFKPLMIAGRSNNIKITLPEDIQQATAYLTSLSQ